MKVFDVETMRNLDRMTIENDLVSGKILMERAGFGAGEIILNYMNKFDPSFFRRFLIICGSGNNGGDGFVISRYLANHCKSEIIVYMVGKIDENKSPDAAFHASLIPESVKVEDVENYDPEMGDVTVDCLLGTGFKGPLKPLYNMIIKKVNSSPGRVVSIDIPSGLNGNDGTFAGTAVKADLTISIAYPKIGIFRNDGPSYSGSLKNVDIGISDRNMEPLLDALFIDDIRRIMPRISLDSHKNSRGSVLVAGGSALYGGAVFLSGEAALRAGAGLCRIVTPNCDVTSRRLSLIVRHSGEKNGYLGRENFADIREDMEKSDSIVLGPGIGTDERTVTFVELMLNVNKKMVIDADALNLISSNRHIWKNGEGRVLTPHPGEMKRLLKGFGLEHVLTENRHLQALELAKVTDSIVILKGFHSIIAAPDGRFRVNTSGNSNLATAGSGDSLTGVIAAFMNHPFKDLYDAASAAVFVHGLAGELSGYGCGTIGDDLPELIAAACKMVRG